MGRGGEHNGDVCSSDRKPRGAEPDVSGLSLTATAIYKVSSKLGQAEGILVKT